jgi:hypothetical protein
MLSGLLSAGSKAFCESDTRHFQTKNERSSGDVDLDPVYFGLSPSCSATVCRSMYTWSERILSPSAPIGEVTPDFVSHKSKVAVLK